MKGLVRGPLLVGGLGPVPPVPPLKSGPGSRKCVWLANANFNASLYLLFAPLHFVDRLVRLQTPLLAVWCQKSQLLFVLAVFRFSLSANPAFGRQSFKLSISLILCYMYMYMARSFFSQYQPRNWLGSVSPILCLVGRLNLNSINQSTMFLLTILRVLTFF